MTREELVGAAWLGGAVVVVMLGSAVVVISLVALIW